MKRKIPIEKMARLFILMATLIWGSAFVVLKNTIDDFPVFYLLAIRFLAAAALLSLVFWNTWKQMNLGYLLRGMAMGVFLFLAYVTQTFGLFDTTPSVNAFLTTTYCVMVPFLYWVVVKKRPNRYHIIAALLCLLGVGLVSGAGPGDFLFGQGEALTLLSGFFFAAHMVAVALSTKDKNVFLLTIIQFATTGLLALACGLCVEPVPTVWDMTVVLNVAYLTVFCTAATLLLQALGQKYTEPAQASVLLSLEAVFAVVFSMLFYGERPGLQMFVGFGLIFVSVLCSETKFAFFRRKGAVKTSACDPGGDEGEGQARARLK